MKKFLVLFACLVTSLAHAQAPVAELRPDSTTQRLTCAEIVAVPGASQADLYARAQAWLATAYQTTPQATAKGTGVVQGTGWREVEMAVSQEKSMPLNLWYTITLAVQPGRYRYAISGFQLQHEPTPSDRTPEKQALEAVLHNEPTDAAPRTDYRHQAAAAAQAIAETIKAAMATPQPSTQGSSR